MSTITVSVVTPEEVAFEKEAEFVAIPLHDGEKGVAVGHAPLIARLGCGELRLRFADGGVERYFIDGGFLQISDGNVSVMTNKALAAGSINVAAVEKQIEDARTQVANSDELLDAREKAVSQARQQLRIASRN